MSGKPRVWISRPTFPDIIARLEPPFDITEEYAEQMVHGAELADRLAGQDAAIVGLKDRIGASEVASATRLRIVANLGVGYDNLYVAALSTAAVAVSSTPDLLIAHPHIASASQETRRAMTSLAVDHVRALFGHGPHAGRPPSILNPHVLAS